MKTTRRVSLALMGVWAVLVAGCVADEELAIKPTLIVCTLFHVPRH